MVIQGQAIKISCPLVQTMESYREVFQPHGILVFIAWPRTTHLDPSMGSISINFDSS